MIQPNIHHYSLLVSNFKTHTLKLIALMSPLLLCTIFSLLSITRAQDRPHGLAQANPMAFSPSAFEFFHPENHQPSALNPCVESGCSPLPVAATVQSNLAYASRSTTQNKDSSGLGAGSVFGIIIGFAFAAFLAMGVYCIVAKRRANMSEKETDDVEA